MGQTVLTLLENFDQDPFGVSRALRDLRDDDLAAFETSAFRTLEEVGDCLGTRLLATILQEDPSLLQHLVDPGRIQLHGAARLVNLLRHADPQVEVRLVRLIMPGADPVSEAVTNRILDLIDAVTDSPKLVPVLMHLYRAAPKNTRARLATTIGRHHRNRDWVEERLRDPDARVRANMVEVYWGDTSDDAMAIFREALRDGDGRVRGNAALGLYRAGSVEPIKALVEMAASDAPGDRASAAWVMGASRDQRFQKILAAGIKDPDALVRRNAFHALSEIKRHQEHRKNRTQCTLRFIRLHRASGHASESFLHILFEVKEEKTETAVKGIKPLDVLLSANGQTLVEYQLVERVKYPQPGIYDLYCPIPQFTSSEPKLESPPADVAAIMLKVEVMISTDRHVGALSSYWFGE